MYFCLIQLIFLSEKIVWIYTQTNELNNSGILWFVHELFCRKNVSSPQQSYYIM